MCTGNGKEGFSLRHLSLVMNYEDLSYSFCAGVRLSDKKC